MSPLMSTLRLAATATTWLLLLGTLVAWWLTRTRRRALAEAAATLGAGPLDRLLTVALPLAWRGLLTAAVLGFLLVVGWRLL